VRYGGLDTTRCADDGADALATMERTADHSEAGLASRQLAADKEAHVMQALPVPGARL
jgi:hypothetical protein